MLPNSNSNNKAENLTDRGKVKSHSQREQSSEDSKKRPQEPKKRPQEPIDLRTPIDRLIFYHGLIPREDMKELLKDDGDFLIRNTELNSGEARTYCLSVRWGEEVRHFALKQFANGLYCIDGKQYFPSIVEMINFYLTTVQQFSQYKITLYKGVPREKWELLHSQVILKDKLGQGAFGEVYLGSLEFSKTEVCTVAVKTMKCANQTKDKIEEIMSEARLMRQLEHRNIVKCYGVAADIEPLYIIMEFVKGGALDGFLRKNGENLELSHRLKMIMDISSAIDYLHRMKIIHRDIAARNCLYGNSLVKLSDFGLSRVAKRVRLVSGERAPIRWTAPEVFLTAISSKASDVWAMGVLFWEIFANGMEPYSEWPIQTVKEQVVTHKQHLTMASDLPEEVKQLVIDMFAYEPENRPSSREVFDRVDQIYLKYATTLKSNKRKPKSRKAGRTSEEAVDIGCSKTSFAKVNTSQRKVRPKSTKAGRRKLTQEEVDLDEVHTTRNKKSKVKRKKNIQTVSRDMDVSCDNEPSREEEGPSLSNKEKEKELKAKKNNSVPRNKK